MREERGPLPEDKVADCERDSRQLTVDSEPQRSVGLVFDGVCV